MSSAAEWDRLVNDKWKAAGMLHNPDAIPTDQQAMRGCRQLYRRIFKRPLRRPVRIADRINGRSWSCHRGALIVNPRRPNRRGMSGWPDIVHDLAHDWHEVLHPQDRPHSDRQLMLERDLTNYVLSEAFAKYRA